MKAYLTTLLAVMAVSYGLYFISHGHHVTKTSVEDTLVLKGSTSVPVTNNTVVLEATKSIKQLNLTSSNTVVLIGEIGSDQALLGQEINEKAKSGRPVYLLINSPGGSVLDGNLIVSAIQSSKVPVYTICMQLCASMASIIFESGTKRYMVDRSILMFHEASGRFEGQFNQMKSRFGIFDKLVTKLDAEIAARVGIEASVFRSKLANELWLDGEDAVNQNFADALVNLNLTEFKTTGDSISNTLSQSSQLKRDIDVKLVK